jgi:beta-lactamase class A
MLRGLSGLLFAGVLCIIGRVPAAAQMPAPLADFQQRLSELAARAPGRVGVAVRDLSTGLETSVNGGSNMPAASVIKIPVMVEVFRQMSLGRVSLDRVVHLRESDRDFGWGDIADAAAGSGFTVKTLLRAMITDSDNTATNMLIRLVGRQHINATMADLGLRDTYLGDYIRSDGDIRSLRTSAADMARLLQRIALEQVVDAWSCREMIAIMAGQRHNNLIPEPLPKGIEIAHKTGTLHDTLNDVGIVFLGQQPYVIAVMTTHLADLDAGRDFIRHVSRLAFDTFSRLAQLRDPYEPLPSELQPVSANVSPDERMWASPVHRLRIPRGAAAQPAYAGT